MQSIVVRTPSTSRIKYPGRATLSQCFLWEGSCEYGLTVYGKHVASYSAGRLVASCCSGLPKLEDCVPLRCNPAVMLKPICRLAHFLKFLLSFPSLLRIFSGCNAALNRLVSLWRYTLRAARRASAFNLGSPPHIPCANDPIRLHQAIDMVPPGNDQRTQATAPMAQQLNKDPPSPSGGLPAPASATQAQAQSDETPYFKKFQDPVWYVRPGVADEKIRYIQRTIDGYVFVKKRVAFDILTRSQGAQELCYPGWKAKPHVR